MLEEGSSRVGAFQSGDSAGAAGGFHLFGAEVLVELEAKLLLGFFEFMCE